MTSQSLGALIVLLAGAGVAICGLLLRARAPGRREAGDAWLLLGCALAFGGAVSLVFP